LILERFTIFPLPCPVEEGAVIEWFWWALGIYPGQTKTPAKGIQGQQLSVGRVWRWVRGRRPASHRYKARGKVRMPPSVKPSSSTEQVGD